jgi:hypothetical protein
MPAHANVIIEYGPYNSSGIVEYKTERLLGLQSNLFKFEIILANNKLFDFGRLTRIP